MKKRKLYKFRPNYAVPPKATLVETMEYLNLTLEQLAERANCSIADLQKVLNKEPITDYLAERLEQGTGIPKQFWLNMDDYYRKRKEKLKKKVNN